MTTLVRNLAQIGVAGAIVLFLPAASCDGGDVNQTDSCPDGEQCSPATPDGLHFVGTQPDSEIFGLGEVQITAVGGTQRVTLEQGDGDARAAFSLPYTARTGTAFQIASQDGNVVQLRALQEATDMLRIADPDGLLYDRLGIAARPIASIVHERTVEDAFEPGAPPQLYAPGSVAYIALEDSRGISLVDDSMRITGDGMTQTAWDMVRVGDLAPGTYPIDIAAGGRTAQLALEVGAGPDRVEPAFVPRSITAGSTTLVCFHAFAGTRPIHVPWSYTADNAAVVPMTLEGCVLVTAAAPGPVAIHARSGALATDASMVANASARRARDPVAELVEIYGPHVLRHVSLGDTAGERAAR